MDAHAHLLSLGWAGPGHSLDSRPQLQHKGRRGLAYDPTQNNNTGRGLVKPLLVSQKKNSFGVGKKTHEPAAGNEWWLKGFEDALSNIGKNSGSGATSRTGTPESPSTAADGGKHTGLYGFFMKGQQMEGTIKQEKRNQSRGKKRKSDAFDDEDDLPTTSRSSTPQSSISDKDSRTLGGASTEFTQISQFLDIRDKDRRRGEKKSEVHPAREFEQVGQFFEAASKFKRRPTKHNEGDNGSTTSAFVKSKPADETVVISKKSKSMKASSPPDIAKTEQRRERRAAKVPADSSYAEEKSARSHVITGTDGAGSQAATSTPSTADEPLRKAESKRRKAQKRLARMDEAL